MKQQAQIEDVTTIIFPDQLWYDDVRELLKCLVYELKDTELILTTERNERFETRIINERDERRAGESTIIKIRHGKEVIGRISGERLRGNIIRRNPYGSADFSIPSDFNRDSGRIVYTGIEFHVTPGYEPGELKSDDRTIMEDTKRVVMKYFDDMSF